MAPRNPLDDGKTWYYNENTGQIQHITNWAEQQLFNSESFEVRFKTQAEAVAYKQAHPAKGSLLPGAPGGGILPSAGSLPGGGALTDLSGFLSALTERNTWIRVGEGLLGLILIGIGIAAVTRSNPVAQRAVKTAAKAAIL